MWLSRIEIDSVRNIGHAELSPAEGYNLITGRNGSGKSSILEALHCLSTGKSFRTSRKLPLIKQGVQRAIVHAQIHSGSLLYRAGVMKRLDGSSVVRLDGCNLDNQAELAQLLPIIGHSPESEDILSAPAKTRQAYLDWTLFHVEPQFRECWRNYRRTLLQRNSALREKMSNEVIQSWDAALASLGQQIDQWRKNTFDRLHSQWKQPLSSLLPNVPLTFSYRQGWAKGESLIDTLNNSLDADRRMGFTHNGPHRADILIHGQLGVATQTLSRGQQKIVSIVLKICQAKDYAEQTGKTPILYVDDFPSELDADNRNRLLRAVLSLDCQTFITATSTDEMPMTQLPPSKVFHVEQGSVVNVV